MTILHIPKKTICNNGSDPIEILSRSFDSLSLNFGDESRLTFKYLNGSALYMHVPGLSMNPNYTIIFPLNGTVNWERMDEATRHLNGMRSYPLNGGAHAELSSRLSGHPLSMVHISQDVKQRIDKVTISAKKGQIEFVYDFGRMAHVELEQPGKSPLRLDAPQGKRYSPDAQKTFYFSEPEEYTSLITSEQRR